MSTTERSASSDSRHNRRHNPKHNGPGDEMVPVEEVEEVEEIEVINRQRLYPLDRRHLADLARAVLVAIGEASSTLSIIIIRDRQMRQLNRDWRGIDQPTDVLSFAYHEAETEEADLGEAERSAATAGPRGHLGDLVISVETAARYATRYGISFEREIDQLVIHGALHLAGYDHETDQGQMNRLEKRLRRKLLPEDEDPGTDQRRQPRR